MPEGAFSSLDFLKGRLCGIRACSIAWIMHWPPKPGTAGSNPAARHWKNAEFYVKASP